MAIDFSPGAAIGLTLFAAAMWGSWMQVVMHLKKYPISGFIFWLYTMSFILIWGITLVTSPFLLEDGIIATGRGSFDVILLIMFGGAIMSLGLLVNLKMIGDIGLLLSTTINGAFGGLLGIATTIWQEGIPDRPMAIPVILSATVVFILASYLCNLAAKFRDQDRLNQGIVVNESWQKGKVTAKAIMMMVICTLLMNGYPMSTAAGTAAQFPPILTTAYLATGSAISIWIYGIITFTAKKQWGIVFFQGGDKSKKPFYMSCISAICHYGGNLISIYSMPVISATFAFLFGRTALMWSFFWGLAYGEFSSAKRRTWIILASGLALFFVGVLLIGVFTLT